MCLAVFSYFIILTSSTVHLCQLQKENAYWFSYAKRSPSPHGLYNILHHMIHISHLAGQNWLTRNHSCCSSQCYSLTCNCYFFAVFPQFSLATARWRYLHKLFPRLGLPVVPSYCWTIANHCSVARWHNGLSKPAVPFQDTVGVKSLSPVNMLLSFIDIQYIFTQHSTICA